jgi:Cu-processing system permease protein
MNHSLIMLKLDISSLMGYTGALFQKFFGSIWGITIVIGSLIVWVLVPVLWFERVVRNKDI